MKILLDECLDLRLRHEFPGHECVTVQYLGFKGVKDGALLDLVGDQFDVLITTDANMLFQQNLKKCKRLSAILITVGDGSIVTVMPLMNSLRAALENIRAGEWIQIP